MVLGAIRCRNIDAVSKLLRRRNDMITLEDIYDMIRDNEKQMEKILKLLEENEDES